MIEQQVRTPRVASPAREKLPYAKIPVADVLRRVSLFSGLGVHEANQLAEKAVRRRLSRGTTIIESGEKSNFLYVFLSGSARVLIANKNGRQIILATLGPGDYVGEMSLIDSRPHSASVIIETMADVLVLARSDFVTCLPHSSTFAFAVMHGLVKRLRNANRQIESLAFMDVYGRVARALLDMSSREGPFKVIKEKVSRTRLADSVGASREMVSRVMTDLHAQGLIETREGGIIFINEYAFSD